MAVVVGSNIIMVPQRNFCMGQRGAPYSLHPTAPTWSDSVGHESILRQTNRQADRQTDKHIEPQGKRRSHVRFDICTSSTRALRAAIDNIPADWQCLRRRLR